MADLVSLEFEGKTLGLTPSNLSKTTIARFFNVHEEGLHLKVVHNGKTENNWPLSNGKFLVPLGTNNAHVIAFNASEDSEDFVQGAFDFRAPSLPRVATNYGMTQGIASRPSKLQRSDFGKRPALGLSFIKIKKKKTSGLVKDIIFSAVDEEGQMVQLFPISINLTELSEKFGGLSVPVICGSIEQELREQGEVVRLVVTDARGQPIMDSSQTRKESFWASQRTFRAMSQQTFKKWKPGVWAALNTGLCTLEEEEEDERGQANQIQKGMPSSSLEEQHLASYANAQTEDMSEIKSMFLEIQDNMESNKEVKRLKQVFTCVICQQTSAAVMYFCVTGCGQLIGCFLCASKIEDCPLCRVSLPDPQLRKPMKVSGLAGILGIPDISVTSALREAKIDVQDEEDEDNEIL